MDAKDFLVWSRDAKATQRAEAAAAAAKAYLYSNVSDEVRAGLETAMTVLLDDPSPAVRLAMADALANSRQSPRNLILSLANDQAEIATIVVRRSPVFLDGELIDLVASMAPQMQQAIAERPYISAGLAAALSELGTASVCLSLLDNPGATIARISLSRLSERFGDHPELRRALLERADLPITTRQNLIRDLGEALNNLVQLNDWIEPERADLVTREACDQATIAIADETEPDDLLALSEHLRLTGQLTAALLLRALCAGNLDFFVAALSVLSRMPEPRLRSVVVDRRRAAFAAVYRRAGLPEGAFDAFEMAVRTCSLHVGETVDATRRQRFTRRIVDEILTRYEAFSHGEMSDLMGMLRRFAAEANRAAAREFFEIEVKAA